MAICAEIELNFSNGAALKKRIKNILGGSQADSIMKPGEFPIFFRKMELKQFQFLIILFSDHGNTTSLLLIVKKI